MHLNSTIVFRAFSHCINLMHTQQLLAGANDCTRFKFESKPIGCAGLVYRRTDKSENVLIPCVTIAICNSVSSREQLSRSDVSRRPNIHTHTHKDLCSNLYGRMWTQPRFVHLRGSSFDVVAINRRGNPNQICCVLGFVNTSSCFGVFVFPHWVWIVLIFFWIYCENVFENKRFKKYIIF